MALEVVEPPAAVRLRVVLEVAVLPAEVPLQAMLLVAAVLAAEEPRRLWGGDFPFSILN